MRLNAIRVATALLLAALVVAGCRPGKGSRPQAEGGDPYLILASELEPVGHQNLYDAIRQLRPFWYTRRVGGRSGDNTVSVYIEDQLVGTLPALRRISVFGTRRVRYMSATEAQTRFGQTNGGRAAIIVELER